MKMKAITLIVFCICFANVKAITFEDNPRPLLYANPDNHGYRMCASWKLYDGSLLHSTCDAYVMNRCGKDLEFDYRCCSGFQHSHRPLGGPNANPCGKLIPQFNDCPSVIEELGFKRFASYLKSRDELTRRNGQPYTIFVPLPESGDGLNLLYGANSDAVIYHVAKGRHYADDLKTGVILHSLFDDQEISIHRTAYGAINVECTEIAQADIECGSGLIHIIRHPLTPRFGLNNYNKSSVMSLMLSQSETRQFARDLPRKLQRDLDTVDVGRYYTVTPPTTTSWLALRNQYSQEQIESIAASHVSSGLRCTSDIIKGAESFTSLQGLSTTIECSINSISRREERKIFDACGKAWDLIDGQSNQVAANGVVHVISGPLIPTSVMTLRDLIDRPECAKYQKIDKFVDVLRECDLHMNDAELYAVIVPDNSAFDWWSKYEKFRSEYERFQVDREYRCETARFHIMRHNGNLANIQAFSGHARGHRTNNLFAYLYETAYFTRDKMGPTLYWHYSPVNNFQSTRLNGSFIYKTARINVIPEKNISVILEERDDLSHTNGITKLAKMEQMVFKKNAPMNLYLVTNDAGWIDSRSEQLGISVTSPDLTRYEGHEEFALKYAMLNHVPLYLYGGDIGYFKRNSVHRFVSTLGIELIFWNDNGVMRIGYDDLPRDQWPRVVEFNIHAMDGIIWVLDGYLPCPQNMCSMQLEDKDTFTFYNVACMSADLEGEKDVKKAFESIPMDIAARHPDKCVIIKQGEIVTVKDVLAETSASNHGHE